MSNPSPNCADTRAALPLYVGGDMEFQELAQVKAHLDDCETCRLHEDRARQARGALVSMLQFDESSPEGGSVWDGVRAGLVAEGLIVGRAADSGLEGERDILVPLRAASTPRPGPSPVRAFPRLRVASLAAAAGLVFALGMIHFLGGEGSGMNGTSGPGGLDGGLTVRTHSAVHGDDPTALNSGHLRPVKAGGMAIHDSALELIPEQGWIVPQGDLRGSNLARNPKRLLPRAADKQ
jgi:hypothetical protein